MPSVPIALILWAVSILITILASVTVVRQTMTKDILTAKSEITKILNDYFYTRESGGRLETEVANTKAEMKTKLEVIDRKLDLICDKLGSGK